MSRGYANSRETYPRPNGVSRGDRMDLRCPNCNGTDLKRISVAYQEGLSCIDARRLRGFVFGSDGPDVIVGKVVTQGVHQTQLSKRLRPPMNWSYLKLIGWSALVSFAALIGYVHSVMGSSTRASALPVAIGTVVLAGVFVLLVGLFWRHNLPATAREVESLFYMPALRCCGCAIGSRDHVVVGSSEGRRSKFDRNGARTGSTICRFGKGTKGQQCAESWL
jgi:hypothetical protein